jgi:hypothetical protein
MLGKISLLGQKRGHWGRSRGTAEVTVSSLCIVHFGFVGFATWSTGSAVLLFHLDEFFGITPPSSVEGLTSNEISIALNLFSRIAVFPVMSLSSFRIAAVCRQPADGGRGRTTLGCYNFSYSLP